MFTTGRCEKLFTATELDVMTSKKSVLTMTIGTKITIENAKTISTYNSWKKF